MQNTFGIAQIGIGQVIAVDLQQLIVEAQQPRSIRIWRYGAHKDPHLKSNRIMIS